MLFWTEEANIIKKTEMNVAILIANLIKFPLAERLVLMLGTVRAFIFSFSLHESILVQPSLASFS